MCTVAAKYNEKRKIQAELNKLGDWFVCYKAIDNKGNSKLEVWSYWGSEFATRYPAGVEVEARHDTYKRSPMLFDKGIHAFLTYEEAKKYIIAGNIGVFIANKKDILHLAISEEYKNAPRLKCILLDKVTYTGKVL